MLLGDIGLGVLARALWPLQNLKILEVMNTGMTDDGALEFVTMLVRGPSVRAGAAVLELSLCGCEIVNTKGETCSTYLTISASEIPAARAACETDEESAESGGREKEKEKEKEKENTRGQESAQSGGRVSEESAKAPPPCANCPTYTGLSAFRAN